MAQFFGDLVQVSGVRLSKEISVYRFSKSVHVQPCSLLQEFSWSGKHASPYLAQRDLLPWIDSNLGVTETSSTGRSSGLSLVRLRPSRLLRARHPLGTPLASTTPNTDAADVVALAEGPARHALELVRRAAVVAGARAQAGGVVHAGRQVEVREGSHRYSERASFQLIGLHK